MIRTDSVTQDPKSETTVKAKAKRRRQCAMAAIFHWSGAEDGCGGCLLLHLVVAVFVLASHARALQGDASARRPGLG